MDLRAYRAILVALFVVAPSRVRAEPTSDLPASPPPFVTLGPALLFGPALTERAYLAGGELGFMVHPARDGNGLVCWPQCIGGLLQVEATNIVEGEQSTLRAAAAVQLAILMLGTELGPVMHDVPGHDAWVGIHAGVFVSVGFASLGVRTSTFPGRFGEGSGAFDLHLVGTLPLAFAWYPDLGVFEWFWHSVFGRERFGKMRM